MRNFLLDTSNGTPCLILHVNRSVVHVSGPQFMAYFGKIQWATGSREAGTPPTIHDLHIISPVVVWSDSITIVGAWAQNRDPPQLISDFVELYPDTDANQQMVKLLIGMQRDRNKHQAATESLKSLAIELISATLTRALPTTTIKQLVVMIGAKDFVDKLTAFLTH